MVLQKKKKRYYLCCMPLQNCFLFARSKQLIFNIALKMYATRSQLRKEVTKIASFFKLHVNNACSAVHNKINKIFLG